MTSDAKRQPGPPRLLLGISLLFWGGMIGHPLIGLIMAVATEAAHWTRVRWDFGEQAYYRAWQASVILVFFAGVLVWMNSALISALPDTIIWLPVLFFPLQFVQTYGMHRTMPMATFSLFVRKRREHARKHGLPFRDIQIAFGHVYFTIIIISSSLGSYATTIVFFPTLVFLVAWAFKRQFSWKNRLTPIAALLALSFAAAGGYSGEKLIDMIYDRMLGFEGSNSTWARQTRTSIGALGEIKQSPNIVWRLKPVAGELPELVRVASYNYYFDTSWRAEPPPETDDNKLNQDFVELGSTGVENPYRITGRKDADAFIAPELASADHLPRFILRGSLNRQDLLPIPSNAASVVIPSQSLEINSLGSLRIEPEHPVANATILWKQDLTTSKAPWLAEKAKGIMCPDLGIPAHEKEVITQVVHDLNLHEGSLEEKINRIRSHFIGEFQYSRYLERPRPESNFERDQFISIFLQESRRGHCEYFATATAMLLREAGIPARYATGFAVLERNHKTGEALLRGTHAHAWCEAWDEERMVWIDVDLTPPDWTGVETPRMPPWQNLLDRWHILRDDLLVWRSEPGNLAIALMVIVIPFVLGGLLVGRRLWKSKRRLDPATERRVASAAHPTTPLTAIEKLAARRLGPRPLGMPLGSWLVGLSSIISNPAQLQEAIALHRAIRFDPSADPQDHNERLADLASQLQKELKV
ncbi:transglutaminase-like domain-containing protein [Haloferula sp.]|uniref:transglutaminase-like domain-containing protein n=1 Tax=Haloferula sp. TaxID=2497595 RepID=UPI00329F0A20